MEIGYKKLKPCSENGEEGLHNKIRRRKERKGHLKIEEVGHESWSWWSKLQISLETIEANKKITRIENL
jgi:hypothetical protein